MAKLTRVTQKQFGVSGSSGDFGVFGSKANPPQAFSQDPTTIQSLSAFLQGWGAAVIGNYNPPMEDMNSLFLLAFRQLAYLFQQGIAEYDSGTTYFIGSLVTENGVVYNSLIDNNTGNDPATDDGTKWQIGIGGNSGGVPTGTVLSFSGSVSAIPSGYLLGNGAAVSRTTYSRLFNVIGTLYGIGDGTTTFNLPDGRGRVLVGMDGTSDFLIQGTKGGEKAHLLTPSEMPSHNHFLGPDINGTTPQPDLNVFGNYATGDGTVYTSSTGGGQIHNNLQPYLVIGGIIIKI